MAMKLGVGRAGPILGPFVARLQQDVTGAAAGRTPALAAPDGAEPPRVAAAAGLGKGVAP